MGTELKNIRILNEEQFKSISNSGYDTSTLYFVETPMNTYVTESSYVQDGSEVLNAGYKKYSDNTVEIWGFFTNNGTNKFTVYFGGDTGVLPNALLIRSSLNVQITPKVSAATYTTKKGDTLGNLGYGVDSENMGEDYFNILLSASIPNTSFLKGFYWKVTGKLKES